MTHVAAALKALTPLDGRYHSQLTSLADLFSEYGLIKARVNVEIAYLIFLSQKQLGSELTPQDHETLRTMLTGFTVADAEEIKKLEDTTRHDVKAVEYFIRQKMQAADVKGDEWLHFALTSEDTNSLAYGLLLKQALAEVVGPAIQAVIDQLTEMITRTRELPMLARTHGQPAVPTTVGKELLVFAIRLHGLLSELAALPVTGKLTGAVGNFNAHQAAVPDQDWLSLSQEFVTSLGLVPNRYTTQIEPPESVLKIFQQLQLINGVIVDLDQDFWRYISDGYFVQQLKSGEVGSSTMPQKVNPIDFENSEGNLGMANAMLGFFVQKLPISRLQRDLSDSTVKRNFGAALGYCVLGYSSCLKGLLKIQPDSARLETELNDHWEVVTEGVQTILRAAGDNQAYEKLKTFSRGKKIDAQAMAEFIEELDVPPELKQRLKLSPTTYIGVVQPIIDQGLAQLQRRVYAS